MDCYWKAAMRVKEDGIESVGIISREVKDETLFSAIPLSTVVLTKSDVVLIWTDQEREPFNYDTAQFCQFDFYDKDGNLTDTKLLLDTLGAFTPTVEFGESDDVLSHIYYTKIKHPNFANTHTD